MKWKVCNGEFIDVLKQVWVWDKAINEWPTFGDFEILEGMKVSQLIALNRCWDKVHILNLFGEVMGKGFVKYPFRKMVKKIVWSLLKLQLEGLYHLLSIGSNLVWRRIWW
ncbi:hypothetical protein MA16_Dca001067 [Dendrobium catenatum]|uniref:Uncharacterized protein n=1 Tax=Dendrobium catenatum TaxID=906689 RepID=A0A2I0WLC5_9ASPA|nr:hypothetical protein MA16_Dca001067 [Dendrobium catenatum]